MGRALRADDQRATMSRPDTRHDPRDLVHTEDDPRSPVINPEEERLFMEDERREAETDPDGHDESYCREGEDWHD